MLAKEHSQGKFFEGKSYEREGATEQFPVSSNYECWISTPYLEYYLAER
jgi:hypothetical protein